MLALGTAMRSGGWGGLRMDDCTLATTRVREDEVLLELHHASHSEAPISLLRLRLLPGGRLWPLWRENPAYRHADPDGLPRGAATVLQEEVGRRWKGWSLVSSTHEMSPEARRFRLAYLERHADMRWELDASLESDEGVEEATPRMDAHEVGAMLEARGLHLPLG